MAWVTLKKFKKYLSINLNNSNKEEENKRFIGSKYVGSKFVSSNEREDTEESVFDLGIPLKN